MRVSLWLGVCIYTYGYIYIDADDDDDDISGHFLFWSAVFLSIWKGNNTFDGKIIVTWLKKKRKRKLHGCVVVRLSRVITFMTQGAGAGLVYMSEMILFCLWFSADFFGPSCVSALASFQARGNRWFFSWVTFHQVFVCLYSFIFIFPKRLSHCDDDVMSDECCIIFVRLCTSQ